MQNINKFQIDRGVRHGDTILFKLFTAVLEYVFQILAQFADDIVLYYIIPSEKIKVQNIELDKFVCISTSDMRFKLTKTTINLSGMISIW